LLAAISVTVLFLASAPPSQADRFAPSISIAGVVLGMNHHQVYSVLGRPRFISSRRSYGRAAEREWHYRDHLTVGFLVERGHTRQVIRVRTKSRHDRFHKGIHVGVKERMVHRLGGVKCRVRSESLGPWPRGYFCFWTVPWAVTPCGPTLEFFTRYKHRRVKYIELSGVEERAARSRRQPPVRFGCY
jgi:hypothetical protein